MTKKILLIAVLSMASLISSARTKVKLTVGEQSLTATLAENDATAALISLLKEAPITISMDDYGGFEKVGDLPQPLPTSNSQISTTPGDIMLYQGNKMVIFYGTNSWSYTPLGRIDDATAESVRQFLGNGSITLTISADTSTDIKPAAATDATTTAYDLKGNLITERPLPPGIYIINHRLTRLP